MKNELKTRPCLKPVFEIISNTDANFVNLHIKQQKHEAINNSDLITHFTKQTLNLNYLLLTLNVTAVIKLPKTEKPIRFLNFKFSLNGGDLLFWFTFNLAVH